MQGNLGSARAAGDTRTRGLRLLINPRRLRLDDRTVIFQHTADGGWFCASFGDGAKYMRAADEDPVLRKRIAAHAQRMLRDRDALSPDLAQVMAAVALAKDYDPDESRDEQGRWTSEGAAGGAAAGAVADAARMFGNPAYAEGLRQLAARALAALPSLPTAAAALGDAAAATLPAAAFFGTLFIPAPRNVSSDGSLPDAPDFSYHFDQEAGHLTIERKLDDGTNETVFDGRYDKDGVFRDAGGNPIGRYLGGTAVALDADAVRGYEARRRSDAQAPPGAIAQTDTATRSDPKVCPDPEPDKPGHKNERAIAYEEWVGEQVGGVVPPGLGLAIRMTKPDGDSIYLDNCVNENHSLVEAKGFNYGVALEKLMTKGNHFPWDWYEKDMMRQAANQVKVAQAQGWNLEWHFADEKVANYMRGKFGEMGYPIRVFYTPPSQSMTERFGRVLEGSSDELRHLFGSSSWR
jgi:hypothetical protein